MKNSSIFRILGIIILTAATTYAITRDVVSRRELNYQIVRDTVYIDLSRKDKVFKGQYQVNFLHDTITNKDSFLLFNQAEFIGILPIGDHGIDSLITQDNL